MTIFPQPTDNLQDWAQQLVSVLTEEFGTGISDLIDNSQKIADIEQSLDSVVGDASANAGAIASIGSSVTELDGRITSVSQAVTNLSARVDNNDTGIEGLATAINTLTTTVSSQVGLTEAISTDLTELSVTVETADLSGMATAISGLDARVTIAEGTIVSHSASITSLNSTITTKITTFYQASAPTATAVGDLWIDSDDNNKLYRWSGASWVAVPPASAGGIATFAQNGAPTALNTGDLWVDTDDDNKIYRWDGGAWVAVDDLRITANASAISTLQTDVTNLNGDITAVASELDALFVTNGLGSALTQFRMEAIAAPAGVDARIALEAITSSDTLGTTKAAMYFDAITGGGSSVAFDTDRFKINTADGLKTVFDFNVLNNHLVIRSDVDIEGNITADNLPVNEISQFVSGSGGGNWSNGQRPIGSAFFSAVDLRRCTYALFSGTVSVIGRVSGNAGATRKGSMEFQLGTVSLGKISLTFKSANNARVSGSVFGIVRVNSSVASANLKLIMSAAGVKFKANTLTWKASVVAPRA